MLVRGRAANIPMLVLQLFILLFTNPWGRVLLGLCVFVGGLVWGLNSRHVAYMNVQGSGAYQVYLSDDNSLLIFQQKETDDYYVMPISAYSPLWIPQPY